MRRSAHLSRPDTAGGLIYAFLLGACCTAAWAQTPRCSDPAIDQAFAISLHRAPRGQAIAGECNPYRYGGGAWSSQTDLNGRVLASTFCNDPWIGQIYFNFYSRKPTPAECNADLYGGWPWRSYMVLADKVKAYQEAEAAARAINTRNPKAPRDQYLVAPDGSLVDSAGAVVVAANSYVLVLEDEVLAVPRPGMILAVGENPATQSSVNSDGKRIITGTLQKP